MACTACTEWNDEWVASLYGELDTEEQARVDVHLASCASCRLTLDELSESRELLQQSIPALPAAPGVIVLQPRRTRQPLWAFATGLACAAAVFLVGAMAGPMFLSPEEPPLKTTGADRTIQQPEVLPASGRSLEVEREIADLRLEFERRLGEIETRVAEPKQPKPRTDPDVLERMGLVQQELQAAQERDKRFLLGEIYASELRTGQALQYVALASNPHLSEQ